MKKVTCLALIGLLVLVIGAVAVNATTYQGSTTMMVCHPDGSICALHVECTYSVNPAGFFMWYTNPFTDVSYMRIGKYTMGPGLDHHFKHKGKHMPEFRNWSTVSTSQKPYCFMGLPPGRVYVRDLVVGGGEP